jgi:hypothetical protein
MFFLASGIISVVLARRSYERAWYGGRAGAESVKTLAWRYMMRAKPFSNEASESEVDKAFTHGLADILGSRRELSISQSDISQTGQQITDEMRTIRQSSLGHRRDLYLKERIQDQRSWYSMRARESEVRQNRWSFGIVAAHFLALAFAVVQVAWPSIPVNLASICAAAAAAFVAWLQARRYQELAQSYAVAAHELSLVASLLPNVASEDEFSTFVSDSEAAISREHTMWIARRDATS